MNTNNPPRSLRALFVAAGADDVARPLACLREGEVTVVHEVVGTRESLQAALKGGGWDVVLLDEHVPSLRIENVLEVKARLAPSTPAMLLIGAAEEAVIVNAMRAGAKDCISKDNLARLLPAIAREISTWGAADHVADVPIAHAAEAFAYVSEVKDYAIYMLDRQGRVLTWNEGARALKGYTADEIIGQSFSRFFTPEDQAAGKPAAIMREAATTGRVEREDWRVRKDGKRLWALIVLTAIHDGQGRLRGFVKVTRDLTERHAAEERLRRSEEHLRLLVESVRDYAIFMLDPNGIVTTWNSGAEHIKGYRADEIVGKHFSTFYPDDAIASGHPEYELRVATAEGRYEEEGWRLRKDGTRFWANVVITAIHDPTTHALRGFAKVTRDLTERLRMSREAKVATEDAGRERLRAYDAEVALKARDEFLSVAAHELRTPLTALMLKLEGVAQLLERSGLEDDKRTKLGARIDASQRQVDRLTELVERLLDVARIMRGELVPDLAEMDLSALVEQVVEDFREPARAAGGEVRFHGAAGVIGTWDLRRLEQVLVNLISNGIKYGNGKPVDVSVERDGSIARVVVRDGGVGIAPEDVERVFLRFERVASASNYGGLGLGLYVAQNIVDAHGGTIEVKSALGTGTNFIVELPMDSNAAAEGGLAQPRGSDHE